MALSKSNAFWAANAVRSVSKVLLIEPFKGGYVWCWKSSICSGVRTKFHPVARKYSVLTEIVDIFTQACIVCIHDEDVAETDFEYTFETPKGFRSGLGKSCAPPAVGHLETS